MSVRLDRKTLVAVLCSLVLAACVLVWLPGVMPSNEGEDSYLDTQITVFRQLQATLTSFRNLELAHVVLLSSPDRSSLGLRKDFEAKSENLEHQVSIVKSMTRGATSKADQFRALQNSISMVVDQLRQSVEIYRGSGAEAAHQYLANNNTAGSMKEIETDLLKLEVEHMDDLKELVARYQNLTSKEFPWIGVVIGTSVLAILLLSLLQSGKPTEAEYAARVESLTMELAETREQLEKLTHLDILTGVLNARGLQHALKAEESRVGRAGTHLVAILVNCDNFSQINAAVGQEAGDIVLKDVARRIVGTLRPSDHVARTGGDEFLILLPDTQLAFGIKVAERIRAGVSERQHYDLPENLEVTVSLGVSVIPSDVGTVDEAIDLARAALERGKVSGKNRVALTAGGSEAILEMSPEEIVATLKDVESYRTVYLPLVRLDSREVVGFEVLTRGPDGAFESPADLFRLCVENDVLTEVDLACLRLGLDKSSIVGEEMRIHFNLFPSTILETPVEDLIAMFPKDRGNRSFWIELSEGNIVGEPWNFRDYVKKLREAGILVAVDDIGFSRQSLETLMILEPDAVKVDRTYVSGISEDKGKVRLLTRLVNVAKSLGAEVVAEGVEREEEIPVLMSLDVKLAQGFLFGPPIRELPTELEAQRNLYT